MRRRSRLSPSPTGDSSTCTATGGWALSMRRKTRGRRRCCGRGWSAKETANLLDESVPSVNSALHRARSQIRKRLPNRRLEWSTAATPTTAEMRLLARYMDATDRADVAGLTALLREEVRLTM